LVKAYADCLHLCAFNLDIIFTALECLDPSLCQW